MKSNFDTFSFVIFPTEPVNIKYGNLTVFWYILEVIFILLLVYLFRVQIKRTSSAIYISPPENSPYKETVELVSLGKPINNV